jgi:hypothetical protein
MSQKETHSQGKKLPVTGRNLFHSKKSPSQEGTSCQMEKHSKIDMDEHNAEDEIENAENDPLLQNDYRIFKNAMNPYWKETVKMETALL